MLLWSILLAPIIFIIVLYVVPNFRAKIALWEPLVMLGSTALLIVLMIFVSEASQTSDTERCMDFVVKIEHHEYWNEWISKTCRDCSTDSKGKEKCGPYYDCSYEREHSPYTKIYTSTGKTYTVDEGYDIGGLFSSNSGSRQTFEKFIKQFNTQVDTEKKHLNDLHVNHGSNYDGDVFTIYYNPEVSRIEPVTWEQTYVNKVQASSSIERFLPVDTFLVKSFGLLDYPKIHDAYKANSIIGENSRLDNYSNQCNALIAKEKQLKVHFLIFKNKSVKAGITQRQYWTGGNKNEVNICIGINDKREIQWCYIFSWSKKANFKVEIRDYIQDSKILDDSTFKKIIDYSYDNLKKNFKRREFKEFDYLNIEPPTWAVVTSYILSILLCLGLSFWITTNEFDSDKTNY